MLKKLSCLFIVLFTAIGMSGCGDDNDEPDNPDGVVVNAALVIGKWQGVSSTGWEKENGKIVDRWNNDVEMVDFPYIEFMFDATGEWRDNDNTHESFTWYINDDYNLVMGEEVVGEDWGDVYRFKTLTKNKMVLISEDKDPEDGWYREDTYKRID